MTAGIAVDTYRIRYTKVGKVRFLGHRDLCRCLERALRRADLPLARTQGFNPRPRLAFGLALPTGAESVAEYLDVDLVAGSAVDLDALPAAVSPLLPPGVEITAAGALEPHLRGGEGSLQASVTSCTWEIALPALRHHGVGTDGTPDVDGHQALAEGVERALTATRLVVGVTRKGVVSDEDVRPALVHLGARPPTDDDVPRLEVELESGVAAGGRSVRPGDVVLALWPDAAESARHRRTAQWIARDGLRRDPLPVAAVAPHAVERALC